MMEIEERQRIQCLAAGAELVRQANDAHEAFIEAGRATGSAILAAANAARRTGICLLRLKEQTPHAKWETRFATANGKPNRTAVSDFHFDSRTGRRYMAIARLIPHEITQLPEAVKTLGELMVAIGAKPEPERSAQNSHGQIGVYNRMVGEIEAFCAIFNKHREKVQVPEWPAQQRELLKEKIRPLAELYETL